jgi:Zn-dependent protease with chaperone function
MAVLGYFLEAFAVAERRLGRERELVADQAGASVTSERVMATALVKVHAYVAAELEKRTSITRCAWCHTKVLPLANGACPSCGKPVRMADPNQAGAV